MKTFEFIRSNAIRIVIEISDIASLTYPVGQLNTNFRYSEAIFFSYFINSVIVMIIISNHVIHHFLELAFSFLNMFTKLNYLKQEINGEQTKKKFSQCSLNLHKKLSFDSPFSPI